MSSPTEQRTPFIRFLDAFFQEHNIKWMLGLGVCLLLGSSLRLVTTHWHECTPAWKYLILIGYTGAVFGLGEFSYHKLGLRKTGTVLMALTVLLIPISFFALHWVRPQGSESDLNWLHHTGLTAMLGINLVWSAFAARRIFQHFLRTTQTTFLVCYLLLCVAGAVAPGLPTAWSPVLALALWAVFAAGTVKVNRHVFWLTEEHRLPRIFGFFPITLLGAQFAAVFLLGLASLTPAWMGLLSTLVALPILLTADAVARVFEQRTGGLVRPIPWSISGPLALGTMLCAAGVILALTGWPQSHLAVPTAALAAAALGVVAQRTRKSAFAWGMVACVMVAYQTSPAFFKELTLYVRDQAAAAVREPRLPYAFYGLTYAPLIITFSLLATFLQRRRQTLFADPLRKTASVLPWLLMLASFTHPSAVLPVAVVLCPLFAAQACLFGQRYLLLPAGLAFLAGAYGMPGFCQRVLLIGISAETGLLIWTAAAGLLLAPGCLVDRWSRSWPWSRNSLTLDDGAKSVCQIVSLLATLPAALIWVLRFSPEAASFSFHLASVLPLLIGVLLAAHTLRWLKPGLGELTLAFATYAALRFALPHGGTFSTFLNVASALLLGQWLLSYALARVPQHRISQAFRRPAMHVSFLGLSILFGLCGFTWIGAHIGIGPFPATVSLLLLIWTLDAARRFESSLLAGIAWSSLFVFSSAAVAALFGTPVVGSWWMTTWAAVGLGLLIVRQTLTTSLRLEAEFSFEEDDQRSAFIPQIQACLAPLGVLLPAIFLLIAGASVPMFGWPQRTAGALALVGLAISRRWGLAAKITVPFAPLLNWQLLAVAATTYLSRETSLVQLTSSELAVLGLPVAALAAVSAWVFQSQRLRDWVKDAEVLLVHESLLVVTALMPLAGAMVWNAIGEWTAVDLAWAAAAWTAIFGGLLACALRTQVRDLVWAALAALLCGFLYFTVIDAWKLTHPAMAYLCLVAGLAFWSIGQFATRSSRWAIVAAPFQQTGFCLPLLVVPFALWRHATEPGSLWAGANSIPLPGASAFYFWRGMARRHVGTTLLSAVILNIAASLLWTELHWTDPQLFLMPIGISILAITELLNREIPETYHDRLRLIGSLTILVSPTFHIVTGSWTHILTLMVASVAVALLAIGLRIRVLLYTGTAFLLADLVALVARGSINQPNLLWIVGVLLGGLVIALGAVCENHRESVLARLRGMAAALEQWN